MSTISSADPTEKFEPDPVLVRKRKALEDRLHVVEEAGKPKVQRRLAVVEKQLAVAEALYDQIMKRSRGELAAPQGTAAQTSFGYTTSISYRTGKPHIEVVITNKFTPSTSSPNQSERRQLRRLLSGGAKLRGRQWVRARKRALRAMREVAE
jgi:hypothetical protein